MKLGTPPWKLGTPPYFMYPVFLAESGGKGDRISRDGLGDRVTRRWGEGENLRLGILKFGCR